MNITLREACQKLGIGYNTALKTLAAQGVITKTNNNTGYLANQKYCKEGLIYTALKTVYTPSATQYASVLVTPAGLSWLQQQLEQAA